jgi:hypothetical protein
MELTAESSLVAVLPLLVHNLEGDVLVRGACKWKKNNFKANNESVFVRLIQKVSKRYGTPLSLNVQLSYLRAESIKRFIEDEAVSPSYSLAPPSSPPYPPPRRKLSLFLSLSVCCRSREEEQNHTTARKPGSLQIIQFSLPSGLKALFLCLIYLALRCFSYICWIQER